MIVPGRMFQFWFLVVSVGSILLSVRAVRKGAKISIREIAGFEALEEAVGRAVEAGKPVHFCSGWSELGTGTLAGLEALRHLIRVAARYAIRVIVTVSKAPTYAVTEQVMKAAYAEAGETELFRPEDCRFISAEGPAASSATIGIFAREKIAANIMIGAFGGESLLLAEEGRTVGALQIAGASEPSQLPFFVAACDYTVIGAEMYAANAYFDRKPVLVGGLRGEDWIKLLSMALIVAGVISASVGNGVLKNLMGL